ncbi:MAG: molybdate ABC transporter substrate-binding protein [Pirellulales bacterium]
MSRSIVSVCLLAIVAVAARPVASAADDKPLTGKVLVLAAASTTDAVEEIRRDFVRLHPGVTVRASYAASSTLARQIEAGAEADVFLSASRNWVEIVAKQSFVARETDLLSNRLVIVVPANSTLQITGPGHLAANAVRHVALADVASVPAGIYAKQALEKLGLWAKLEGKVTGAADVRQALAFVESAAAEAGIVYATDAAASRRVRVAAQIDTASTEKIEYTLALLKHGAERPVAVAWYEYLKSPAAAAVFQRHGFIVPGADKPAKAAE